MDSGGKRACSDEEYAGKEEAETGISKAGKPVLIVLSARDRERLRESAKNLIEVIEREGYGEGKLAEIAYTLQIGRERMEERLGFMAETIEEIKEKLKIYIKGEEGTTKIYSGQIKRNKETVSRLQRTKK